MKNGKQKKELVKKYRDKIANPFIADESGYIDEVIDPAITRKKIDIPRQVFKFALLIILNLPFRPPGQ